MNTNDGVNAGIFLGQVHCPLTALDGSTDGDDACNTGLGRPPQNIIEVTSELRIIEMGVSLYQHFVIPTGNIACHPEPRRRRGTSLSHRNSRKERFRDPRSKYVEHHRFWSV